MRTLVHFILAILAAAGAWFAYTRLAPPSPAQVRAQVESVVAEYRCARLQTFVRGRDVRVKGFVSSDVDRNRLTDALKALPHIGLLAIKVEVYIWPHCEVVTLLDGVGTDVPPDQHPLLEVHPDTGELRVGNRMVLQARAGGFDGYLYIDYFDRDGNVVHLFPNPPRPDNKVERNAQVVIGRRKDGGRVYRIHYPVGIDLATVITSDRPLFTGLRPELERAEAYLADLRQALSRAEKDRTIVASAFLLVETVGESIRDQTPPRMPQPSASAEQPLQQPPAPPPQPVQPVQAAAPPTAETPEPAPTEAALPPEVEALMGEPTPPEPTDATPSVVVEEQAPASPPAAALEVKPDPDAPDELEALTGTPSG